MKKVLCEIFGEGETLCFNIAKLAKLEQLEKRSILTVLTEGQMGIGTIINGYVVGLSHCKHRTAEYYAGQIQYFLEEGIYTLQDLINPLMKALMASGLFGKQAYYDVFPEELTEEAATDMAVEKKARRKNK